MASVLLEAGDWVQRELCFTCGSLVELHEEDLVKTRKYFIFTDYVATCPHCAAKISIPVFVIPSWTRRRIDLRDRKGAKP